MQRIVPPGKQTDDDLSFALLAAAMNYHNDKVPYIFDPGFFGAGGYNSNDFFEGLLASVGVDPAPYDFHGLRWVAMTAHLPWPVPLEDQFVGPHKAREFHKECPCLLGTMPE